MPMARKYSIPGRFLDMSLRHSNLFSLFTNTMPFHRWPIRTDFYEGNEHHIETDIAKSIKMIFESEGAYGVGADGRM